MPRSDSIYDKTLVFHRPEGASSALVFIHGGAWIDENNTADDFKELSDQMLESSKKKLNYVLASIDYRLSPQVRHPVHLHDTVESLYKLIQELNLDSLQLVGHSVGATLAWQVAVSDEASFPAPEKLLLVKSRLAGVFLVDGIYSLTELLDEYPSYDYFVSQAFEDSVKDFEEFGLSINRIPSNLRNIHLLHSYRDELLTLRQTNYMSSLLQKAAVPFSSYFSDMGLHEEVYRHAKLANYLLSNVVFV